MSGTNVKPDGTKEAGGSSDRRRRVKEVFWLNARNPRDKRIGKYLEAKRAKRQFTETIRNGAEIMLTLEQGDPTLLIALFPHITRMLSEFHRGI